MSITFKELKELVIDRCDPDMLVDILELTTEQLVEAFPDELEEQAGLLIEVFGDDDKAAQEME